MSAPLVVNTRDGACWTRRAVTEGGIALYALADVCSCPEFAMATLAELAEHGITGSADVLPVPVGPQMPDFPPPPRTELEKLRAERARLQGLLAEAVAEAHRARRERELMRERVSEPFGCQHCGTAKRSHGRRYLGGVGMHGWERPTDEQVKDRMLARRAARMPLVVEELRARVAELEAQRAALAVRLRSGQRWKQGRRQPLVSQDYVSQDELRAIFGIALTAPWDAPAEDPCHPCGCPKRFNRHADGCPAALRAEDTADILTLANAQHADAKYNSTFQTIELELTATPDQWTAWQKLLMVDLARTTNRGSCVTSHATWRGIHVVIRCWLVQAETETGGAS